MFVMRIELFIWSFFTVKVIVYRFQFFRFHRLSFSFFENVYDDRIDCTVYPVVIVSDLYCCVGIL